MASLGVVCNRKHLEAQMNPLAKVRWIEQRMASGRGYDWRKAWKGFLTSLLPLIPVKLAFVT